MLRRSPSDPPAACSLLVSICLPPGAYSIWWTNCTTDPSPAILPSRLHTHPRRSPVQMASSHRPESQLPGRIQPDPADGQRKYPESPYRVNFHAHLATYNSQLYTGRCRTTTHGIRCCHMILHLPKAIVIFRSNEILFRSDPENLSTHPPCKYNPHKVNLHSTQNLPAICQNPGPKAIRSSHYILYLPDINSLWKYLASSQIFGPVVSR